MDKRLPLALNARGFDLSAFTKNLSCVGAYCRIARPLPLLTKLDIVLALDRQSIVKCRGVVVRVDNIEEDGCNIAIFFNRISEKDKDKIRKLVLPEAYVTVQ